MVKRGEFSLQEVAERDGQNGAETWVVIKDIVYNMTEFLKEVKVKFIDNLCSNSHYKNYHSTPGVPI